MFDCFLKREDDVELRSLGEAFSKLLSSGKYWFFEIICNFVTLKKKLHKSFFRNNVFICKFPQITI